MIRRVKGRENMNVGSKSEDRKKSRCCTATCLVLCTASIYAVSATAAADDTGTQSIVDADNGWSGLDNWQAQLFPSGSEWFGSCDFFKASSMGALGFTLTDKGVATNGPSITHYQQQEKSLLSTSLPIMTLAAGGLGFLGSRVFHCNMGISQRAVQHERMRYASKWIKRSLPSYPCDVLGVFLFVFFLAFGIVVNGADLRDRIMKGNELCFHFVPEMQQFQMNCSVLQWAVHSYGADTYISLDANEVFDGGGRYGGVIDLNGTAGFKGLFAIMEHVASFDDAPLIKNMRVKGGVIAEHAGFIVRKDQRFFVADSCSSTGDILAYGAGGICGSYCGRDNGEIKIMNSFSSGKIGSAQHSHGGGITGEHVGDNQGRVNVTRCYSMGHIGGFVAGGVLGDHPGFGQAEVFVFQSYSLGDILESAEASGGIIGGGSGASGGTVHIEECFSTGELSADESGGISGHRTAVSSGNVHIINCYTRGNIHGKHSGGIAGDHTGDNHEESLLNIADTYASGVVTHSEAGTIIGSIPNDNSAEIQVHYCVYNGTAKDGASAEIVGTKPSSSLKTTGNSGELEDIRGRLYQPFWSNSTWAISGPKHLPILRFQLLTSSTPTPRSTRTATVTPTVSVTTSKTPTASISESNTVTSTITTTFTSSPTSSTSPSVSPSSTPSTTSTSTLSTSATPTHSATSTASRSRSSTWSSTPSVSTSRSNSGSVTGSSSQSISASVSSSPTPSSSVSQTPTSTKSTMASISSTVGLSPRQSLTGSNSNSLSNTITSKPTASSSGLVSTSSPSLSLQQGLTGSAPGTDSMLWTTSQVVVSASISCFGTFGIFLVLYKRRRNNRLADNVMLSSMVSLWTICRSIVMQITTLLRLTLPKLFQIQLNRPHPVTSSQCFKRILWQLKLGIKQQRIEAPS
eukprot:gb/GECG01008986.1/.p1 GENE.gb/GECG01008986.1/~~gb/GECG01008986.1/.p1  ORF type:complete len:913 (+),score=82.73 gb/GECG01008986.1/:1-2739(+)